LGGGEACGGEGICIGNTSGDQALGEAHDDDKGSEVGL
jgi:hypothetical protein